MVRPPLLVGCLLVAVLADPASGQRGGRPGRARPASDGSGTIVPAAAADAVATVRTRTDGVVRSLRGRFTTTGEGLAARATSFVAGYGAFFDAGEAVVLEPRVASGQPEVVVRLVQTIHGFALQGHGLTLVFDGDGRTVVHAHGAVSPAAARMPPPRVGPDRAVELARDATGLAGDAPPVVRPIARLTAGGPVLVHRVELVVDLHPWAIEIDAHDGTLLAVLENLTHGTGTYPWNGSPVLFETGKGKGNVYKRVGHAVASKAGTTKLPHLATEDAGGGLVVAGSLIGRYAQVLEPDGGFIVTLDRSFRFDDDDPALVVGTLSQAQLFDHANTYHWVTEMGDYFTRSLGITAGDVTVPTYVNFDDGGFGYANAFYTDADLDGPGGLDPGYMVFGEIANVTGDPMDDLSRDPTIVCHEYTHLVADKLGLSFGAAPLDTPPRAVNEAIADYAAATYLEDPRLGAVFVTHATELGLPGTSLRDLEQPLVLANDLWGTVGDTGLPEEHEAGEIFGAALWSARELLGAKRTDALVLGGLADWPAGTAEVGFPVVDPDNAEEAYQAYFHACLQAMTDRAAASGKKGDKLLAGLLGAFLAHGITGVEDGPVHHVDATETGLKLAVKGRFPPGIDALALDVSLAAGQQVTVKAKGRKGTTVDIGFDDDPGDGEEPGDLTYGKPKATNKKGTKSVLSRITVNEGRTYRLTLGDPSGAGGAWKLVLKVKS